MITGYNPWTGWKNRIKSQSGKRMKSTFLSHNNINNNNYYYWNAREQGTEPPTAPAELLSGWQHMTDMAGKSQVWVCQCVCELSSLCRLRTQMWFKVKLRAENMVKSLMSQLRSYLNARDNKFFHFWPCERFTCSKHPLQCKPFGV